MEDTPKGKRNVKVNAFKAPVAWYESVKTIAGTRHSTISSTIIRLVELGHTFASDLTMAGHSDRTVAQLLGHTSTQMVARYAHLAPSHLRRAIEGLTTANQPPTRQASRRSKTA